MQVKLIPAFLILCLVILFSNRAFADFNWVKIGVDGLTCPQCSRGVELSIRKLDFVQDVEMNLQHTEGKITFKPGVKVDVEKIAQAVVDAGFSVRYLLAGFVFDNTVVSKGFCYPYEESQFQFVKTEGKTLNGETTLKFIGKEFQSGKEYKHWKSDLIPVCDKLKGKIFYVTL